jgi:hypothetical protein
VGCGRNVENDESLWIIYDYLGLSMDIYEYLCLFTIIYVWEVETDAGYVIVRHGYVIL